MSKFLPSSRISGAVKKWESLFSTYQLQIKTIQQQQQQQQQQRQQQHHHHHHHKQQQQLQQLQQLQQRQQQQQSLIRSIYSCKYFLSRSTYLDGQAIRCYSTKYKTAENEDPNYDYNKDSTNINKIHYEKTNNTKTFEDTSSSKIENENEINHNLNNEEKAEVNTETADKLGEKQTSSELEAIKEQANKELEEERQKELEKKKKRREMALKVREIALQFGENEAPRPDVILDIVREKGGSLEWYNAGIVFFGNREYKYRKGTVDFCKMVLADWENANVVVTREMYTSLLAIFPDKGRLRPRTFVDVLMPIYTQHVDMAMEILQKMEENQICPDIKTYDVVMEIFGKDHPVGRKMHNMIYWFTEFGIMPDEDIHERYTPRIKDKQVRMDQAFKKMHQMVDYHGPGSALKPLIKDGEVDVDIEIINVHNENEDFEIDEYKEKGDYIVIATNAEHKQMTMEFLKKDVIITIDGPYMNWFDNTSLPYYILRASVDYDELVNYKKEEITENLALDGSVPNILKNRIIGLCMINDQTGTINYRTLIGEKNIVSNEGALEKHLNETHESENCMQQIWKRNEQKLQLWVDNWASKNPEINILSVFMPKTFELQPNQPANIYED